MGEIMNSPKGVKSCVSERVSISCPTCGTRQGSQTGSHPVFQCDTRPTCTKVKPHQNLTGSHITCFITNQTEIWGIPNILGYMRNE